jgi:serine/threonine protein kinase
MACRSTSGVRNRKLDVRSRVKLMLGVLDAVHYAHSQLVIHRDIKPSNLLVTAEGKVKLLDFGVSTLVTSQQPGNEGRGRVFGTPRFAAPEQMKAGTGQHRVDIYTLGLLFHLLLCGRHAKRHLHQRGKPKRRSRTGRWEGTCHAPLAD